MIAALLIGIATSPWMRTALRNGAIVLAVLLFLLSLRRFGEQAGRLAERLETTEKANDCEEARNKDPVSGVIGFQKGPLRRWGSQCSRGHREVVSGNWWKFSNGVLRA